MGKAATAVNSANNTEKLINALQESPTDKTLILCLDKDSAGQKAQKELANACKRLNITYITAGYKQRTQRPQRSINSRPGFISYGIKQGASRRPERASSQAKTL